MIRDNARSKELKNTKALNLIWMIKEWAANLNRNFDDLECSIDELYPHLKKIKKIILKDVEDGNWKNVSEFCDYLEEENYKYSYEKD
jgi:hypothetical protein|tara:strand:- start:3914 stop:4174 length:261 start_codon:yes stop_codon:yes gene_type:complete